MPIVSLLAAAELNLMPTSGATTDDKVDKGNKEIKASIH